MKTVCQMMMDSAKGYSLAIADKEKAMRDPNEPSIYDCGAPYNLDDEGNCDCARCGHSRRRTAKDKWYEEHGPDYEDEHRMAWDELNEAGQRRRVERMADHADFRRKEIKENELMGGVK
jgi:hypothetical protein